MRVGIVNLIAVREMTVFTYVLATYELALGQADELCKGVTARSTRVERPNPNNGNRETIITFRTQGQILHVQDIEVADAVLTVDLRKGEPE